ncbi:EscV/YscV/HrcV family type III secretion system export apparatus protein [Hahella sp. KA22]|uniref:type III secretion system export apparatus subunit SctV n=1 Tax=Hahella sp. KA22 TaxID=1628392 RepID=UPI000FDD39D3|nr:type III secretion system export apparatus subunit SctV [Hahella sp. KA22]AZZ91046.1 EscV/YscV/HrcV family type III secretion system export apparatus protein [Hahella sp. KA22]QAY54416.1 EscV/YscV/HrcV family type III secretion system export apparatus protein [Hahella sp. KA22]
MSRGASVLSALSQRNDVVLAIFLVGIIFMMILPMPTMLVDVMIALNMGVSVILLMLALYIKSPLDFSVFPSMLLITTMFRLALSITTTRLILLQADAGQIVYTFGNFVVGGNLVVGGVIFLILTIVQFLVITKGSERVAEVSARFSLDSMPGKQMSIDGDMRAGVIDMDEARIRRAKVEKESQLYGSMDGAMKFVKGDAIAGLIITAVNILGGILVGVTQNGLSAGDAAAIYSVLTIGDGLVAQIPALFISITAGFIVTRVSTDESENLGRDIGGQIGAQPKALFIGGALLLGFAMIPGFPTMTFLVLAGLISSVGFIMSRKAKHSETDDDDIPAMAAAGQTRAQSKTPEKDDFSPTVPLLLDVAASCQQMLKPSELNAELYRVRRALYLDLGVPFPGIHLRFNESMKDGEYTILMHEVPVAQGRLPADKVVVLQDQEQLDILGIPHQQGELAMSANPYWVEKTHAPAMENAGIEYLDAPRLLIYHLSFILKRYASEFIGLQECRYLLDQMEGQYGDLVKEVQRVVPIQRIAEILQRLVSEDISIRNLRAIMEALVEWGQKEKDTVLLTEYVRKSLSRYISYKFCNGQNVLPAYMLDQDLEESIRGGIRQTSSGAYLALDPDTTQNFINELHREVGDLDALPHKPVLLVSMDIRRYVRKMIERDFFELCVLSYQELTQDITVQPISRICL